MGYIGAHGVAALHRYKYSGVDHSYLAKYVLQPFWTRFVKILPLWMLWREIFRMTNSEETGSPGNFGPCSSGVDELEKRLVALRNP